MYMLIKDTLSYDEKWLVGSYDTQGNWKNAPLVAGYTSPSYSFDVATQHMSNLNAMPAEGTPKNTVPVPQAVEKETNFMPVIIAALAALIILPIIVRIVAALVWASVPLLLVGGLLYIAYLRGK